MEFYERISGARMHAAFHKPANIFFSSLDQHFLNDILYFIQIFIKVKFLGFIMKKLN